MPIDLSGAPIEIQPLGCEALMLAIPVEHPLAKRRFINLANLQGEPTILFRRDVAPESHDRITAACRESGTALKIAFEVEGLQAALSLACAGLGIAFVPASARLVPRHGIAFVPLRQPKIELHLGLATRKVTHHDPVLEIVRTIITETAGSIYT
jgi:DNA-binding transcriptional LysR family regulator